MTLPAKTQKSCMDAALGYLATRMRSALEMQGYLTRKGHSEEEIEAAMSRLCELGLIDDTQFVNELIRAKTNLRPIGRRALAYSLQQKGVSKQTIEQGLSSYSPEDERMACRALFEKLAKKHGTDRQGLVKIQRALVSRGFGYEMIQQTASHFLEREDWE